MREALILKVAYCVNNNGEKTRVSAHDASCNKYFGRLTCPFCGEQVDWVNGQIQDKHFRHHHGSYRHDCENYCTSISANLYMQPYEREGLPLYLINEFGTYFLALGLYGLEEITIQEAEEMGLEMEIDLDSDSKIIRKITLKQFVPNRLEFVRLSGVKEQYHISFNQRDLPSEIKKKWFLDINGIGINGAIFHAGENGGKKVSSAVGVKVNEEYLLFTRDKIDSKHFFSISFELLQELDFGWRTHYRIYKLSIKEINKETIDFCNRLDMNLTYSQPEIIPLWPPCTKFEQELIYASDCAKYFILNTDDSHSKGAFSHKLQSKLQSEKIDDRKSIITTHIKSDDFVSIASLNRPFIFSIIRRTLRNIQSHPEIRIEQIEKKIKIETETKLFVNYFKNDLLIKSIVLKSEHNEIIAKSNEMVDIVYGTDIVWFVRETKNMVDMDAIEKLDQELLQRIRMCRGEMVKQPDSFKWQILKIKKYKASYRELSMQLKSNRISEKLIRLLRKY